MRPFLVKTLRQSNDTKGTLVGLKKKDEINDSSIDFFDFNDFSKIKLGLFFLNIEKIGSLSKSKFL